jgi:hypothetical protein
MLSAEESYTESQWQEELLQIILLLYPKYIYLFKEAPKFFNNSINIDSGIEFSLSPPM